MWCVVCATTTTGAASVGVIVRVELFSFFIFNLIRTLGLQKIDDDNDNDNDE